MLRWGDDWITGMSGEITEVPAGFSHETILVAGAGVTATMDYYGGLMRWVGWAGAEGGCDGCVMVGGRHCPASASHGRAAGPCSMH